MLRNTILFLSILFVAFTLMPYGAHLLELSNKIHLQRDDYFTVQHIYNGWALVAGILIFGALFLLIALVIISRKENDLFPYYLTALIFVIVAQVIFWVFTFPANQATSNWTSQPENWDELRKRWEYSHATGAFLHIAALIALIWPLTFGSKHEPSSVSMK